MPDDFESKVVANLILLSLSNLIDAVLRSRTLGWILDRWRLIRWGFLQPNKQRYTIEKDIQYEMRHPELVRRIMTSGW